MSGVSLGGLLAAAVVSVALGVEWLAKPRLEVRKERILAQLAGPGAGGAGSPAPPAPGSVHPGERPPAVNAASVRPYPRLDATGPLYYRQAWLAGLASGLTRNVRRVG